MPEIAGRAATYEDVLASPPHVVAEIVGGVLHHSPRPALPHAMAVAAIGGELTRPFGRGRGGPGGWIILIEPEVHLAEDVVVPDLAGWRRETHQREGVTHVWLLEPLDRLLEVLERDADAYRIIQRAVGDEPARLKPFEAIAFDVAALWSR